MKDTTTSLRRRTSLALRLAAGAILLQGFFPLSAQAQELRLSSGYPRSAAAHAAIEAFEKHVEANSPLRISVHHSGSLLSFAETPTGLRDGVVDIGVILPPYYPSEFPDSNLVANLSMLATTGKKVEAPGAAMVGATMEYIFNCKDCQDTYKKQNEVYLGSLSSNSFDMMCKAPIKALSDLKGKKVRVGAANFGRFVEHFGGTQVSMPAGEMYDALAQGVVDCAVLSVADLRGFKLGEVAPHTLLGVPGGVYSGVDPQNFNRASWKKLTPEQRAVVLKAASFGSAHGTAKYFNESRGVSNDAKTFRITIHPTTEEMSTGTANFLKADLPVIKAQFEKDFKVTNVDAKIAEVTKLVDKWKGLTEKWNGDADALADIYWREIFSKIDAGKYGLD